MRIRSIKSYEEANRFLKEDFLPWYNEKYTYRVEESIYRALTEDKNLNLVFSPKDSRKVNKDNTLRYEGRIFQ